jgi:hypothetical protein
VGGDDRWLINDRVGGRNLGPRTLFFDQATLNTPPNGQTAPVPKTRAGTQAIALRPTAVAKPRTVNRPVRRPP